MEDAVEGSWGKLVGVSTNVDTSPYPLVGDKFTIGRARDCDISLSNNKLVSGRHCHIEKDADGKVWLCDTSTNGTLLNVSVKITKGNRRELNHGDEFFVVYKRDEDDFNIGYMYQNLEELQKEMDATQEYSSGFEIEATLIDDCVNIADEDDDEQSKKRPSGEADSEPPAKRVKTETDSSEFHTSKTEANVKDIQGSKTPKGKEESQTKGGQEKTTPEDKSDQKETSSADKGMESTSKSAAGSGVCQDGPNKIEEALICTICQEILYDCISLQPCMHSFCAGCYSDWMDKSNECPTCRMKVERINKNHIVNNLIEAYLQDNPGKRRDEEDIKELDAKNKISRDMLYPESNRHRRIFDSSDSDGSWSGSGSGPLRPTQSSDSDRSGSGSGSGPLSPSPLSNSDSDESGPVSPSGPQRSPFFVSPGSDGSGSGSGSGSTSSPHRPTYGSDGSGSSSRSGFPSPLPGSGSGFSPPSSPDRLTSDSDGSGPVSPSGSQSPPFFVSPGSDGSGSGSGSGSTSSQHRPTPGSDGSGSGSRSGSPSPPHRPTPAKTVCRQCPDNKEPGRSCTEVQSHL
ncbi:E3 ubiquitin-protein ligase CHFR-like isoform X2 [Argopecten irradians]|uniref:E3 ubiquitin-protein ligase CHFR-like isoform X2 n=1 Tax=Argopecten irradians TaxID=31199 RepID=UPI00371AC8A4